MLWANSSQGVSAPATPHSLRSLAGFPAAPLTQIGLWRKSIHLRATLGDMIRKGLSLFLAFMAFPVLAQFTQIGQLGTRPLGTVHLEAGSKYLVRVNQGFQLLNADLSLYRNVFFPTAPVGYAYYLEGESYWSISVESVSEGLFDLDLSTIEYVVYLRSTTVPADEIKRVMIVRENGDILFDQFPTDLNKNISLRVDVLDGTAYMTVAESLLNQSTWTQSYESTVYMLPGSVVCGPCESTTVGMNPSGENSALITLYPNPTSSSGYLNVGIGQFRENEGYELKIYDNVGRYVRGIVPNAAYLTIPISQLSAGSYVLQLSKGSRVLSSQIFVVQ